MFLQRSLQKGRAGLLAAKTLSPLQTGQTTILTFSRGDGTALDTRSKESIQTPRLRLLRANDRHPLGASNE